MICINMTNEELIEELYHKAHQKGFFNELHEKANEIKKQKNFEITLAEWRCLLSMCVLK